MTDRVAELVITANALVDSADAERPDFDAQIRSAKRQPSGVTRSCTAGKTTTQRELMGAFACPRSGRDPQGARQYSRHENIVFMALKKFCCLESEAEAQGSRISATPWCWEGRSQRLPTPWWRTTARTGSAKQRLTVRVGGDQ
ncbi:hypothetical protein CVS27_00840 [Arthrobacter glacialis]|uniref:Uncharacterized protein n=1 Tax=Arthrobacter glacialis TaxID=1664 RepID=A0A2S4A107_ARTGL|nr:hypothetical protein CVS27_00840 [Arthrobacter glacialis]